MQSIILVRFIKESVSYFRNKGKNVPSNTCVNMIKLELIVVNDYRTTKKVAYDAHSYCLFIKFSIFIPNVPMLS